MDFREELLQLKVLFNVRFNKELADKLEITEDAINGWTKRKTIPKKYKKLLENSNNNIQINGHNNGQIVVSSENELCRNICEDIQKLPQKRQEYYYHKIKAELLEIG